MSRAIELAKECGFGDLTVGKYQLVSIIQKQLEAFYEAAKKDGMIEMRERAKDAVRAEYLVDHLDTADDIAYNNAVNDCLEAIRKLEVE